MRLFGINPVAERLEADPRSVRKVYLNKRTSVSRIYHLCREAGVPVEALSDERFARLSAGVHAQGVIAETAAFAYLDYASLLDGDAAQRPTLVFLDELNDPQNLGSILRTLACLGGFAVVLPKHASVAVTEAVLRVASGGENFVSVALVANLSQAVLAAKEARYWIVAAVTSGGTPAWSATLPSPAGVILGAEGRGVRPGVLKHADVRVTLPMAGADLSFNVAVACALLSYEIIRQRRGRG